MKHFCVLRWLPVVGLQIALLLGAASPLSAQSGLPAPAASPPAQAAPGSQGGPGPGPAAPPAATPATPAALTIPPPLASPDDTARFLAGLPPSPGSPLAALTSDPAWQAHARFFDAEWRSLEARQLSKVRAFASQYLAASQKTLFYMFSGPDYLYAEALYPKVQTYVMSGLEPVGPLPDPLRIRKNSLPQVLQHLKASLTQIIGRSYFITLDMDKHLRQGQLTGVLPVLYVFLARSGKTIKDVTHMRLEPDGKVVPITEPTTDRPRVVRIVFSSPGRGEQTLYFFNTNLADQGVASSGFLQFCETLGTGDSFVKSASYLLHGSAFSTVRTFLLTHSATILQDDTGVPVRDFKPEDWSLRPFGRYTTPIPVFRRNFQKGLKELFDKGNPVPFDFSLGYRWRAGQSNLLLATRK